MLFLEGIHHSRKTSSLCGTHRDRKNCHHQQLLGSATKRVLHSKHHQLLCPYLCQPNTRDHYVQAGQTKEGCVWASSGQKVSGLCGRSQHACQREIWCPAPYRITETLSGPWLLVQQRYNNIQLSGRGELIYVANSRTHKRTHQQPFT